MSDFYVDLSSIGIGHIGATGDPFSLVDMCQSMTDRDGSVDTYFAKGCGETSSDFSYLPISMSNVVPWDPVLYGPYRIRFAGCTNVWVHDGGKVSGGILVFPEFTTLDGTSDDTANNGTYEGCIIIFNGGEVAGLRFKKCVLSGGYVQCMTGIGDPYNCEFIDSILFPAGIQVGSSNDRIHFVNCVYTGHFSDTGTSIPAVNSQDLDTGGWSFPNMPVFDTINYGAFIDLQNAVDIDFDYAKYSDPSPLHTPPQPGSLPLNTVATLWGAPSIGIGTGFIIYTPTLIADFSGDPLVGYNSTTVHFTDLSIGNPTSWDWDFGDGVQHATIQNPVHAYMSPGLYSVTLTVTNAISSNKMTRYDYISVGVHTSPNLFIEQFQKDRPNINAFVRKLYDQLDIILTECAKILQVNNLDASSGADLDKWGSVVGLPRNTLDDSQYRNDIKFTAFLNTSKGTPEILIAATKQLTGATIINLEESFPAHVRLTINKLIGSFTSVLAKLRRIKPAGVGLTLLVNEDTSAFAFAGEGGLPPYFPAALGFEETGSGSSVGGKLTELIS